MRTQAGDEARRNEVLALPTRAARWHADLAPPRSGVELVTVSIGHSGEAICLWSSPAGQESLAARTTRPSGVTFPDARPSTGVAAVVTAHTPELSVIATIPTLMLAHPTVQRMPGGNVLAVGARAYWRSTGADRNAVVFTADGAPVREATLGDGIAHVQTTPSGAVWVGYFDEGVYGNLGWNSGEAPAPIGRSGLVRFNSKLELDWEYPSGKRKQWGSISDCYALNVADETAWACYYSGFPIVRVNDRAVEGWTTGARGVSRLVTDGRTALLVGGYGPDCDLVVEGQLEDGRLRITKQWRLTLPDGAELPPRFRMFGRGAELHVIVGHRWYRLDLFG